MCDTQFNSPEQWKSQIPQNDQNPQNGQPPQNYVQSPQVYGQLPPNNGEFPQAYGQTPPNYGEVPQSYGQVPPNYGQIPPNNGGFPQNYGQNAPNGYYGQPNQYQGYNQAPIGYQQPFFAPLFDHPKEKAELKRCMLKLAIFGIICFLNFNFLATVFVLMILPLLRIAYNTSYELYYFLFWLVNDVSAYIIPALSAFFLFRKDLKNKGWYGKDSRYKPVLSEGIVFATCCFLGSLASIITNFIANILDELFGTGQITDNMEAMLPSANQPFCIFILFFFVAVAAPIVEELIYRKLLLYPLRKYSDGFAVVVTALLFGFMHGNLNQAPYAVVVGLLFGTLAVRSNSVIPSMILHVVNNLTVTFGSYYPMIMGEDSGSALMVSNLCSGFLNVLFWLGIPATVVLFATGFHQTKRITPLSKADKASVLVRSPATYIFGLSMLAMLFPIDLPL